MLVNGQQQQYIPHEEAFVIVAKIPHDSRRCSKTVNLMMEMSSSSSHHQHIHILINCHTVQETMAEECSGCHAIIDVNGVVKQHTAVIPKLLGTHALSGCDTVSSFVGIDKANVF